MFLFFFFVILYYLFTNDIAELKVTLGASPPSSGL